MSAITKAVSDQLPSEEHAQLQRRKELFEKLGTLSLSISGIIAGSFLIFLAAYYKMMLLGPEVLFWSGLFALIGFLLLSIFFSNYAKLFMKPKALGTTPTSDLDQPEIVATTAKLLDDPPFEPISSVTEDSTDLLATPLKERHK